MILECIDSPDITIRIQALDLVQGMVTSDSLVSIVSRLMKQLKSAAPPADRIRPATPSMEPSFDSDDEFQPAMSDPTTAEQHAQPLPEDYRLDVIGRILFMCSKDNYANVADFDWYIDVLTQLVRMAPVPRQYGLDAEFTSVTTISTDISEKIGDELRNVAVKVRALRSTAVRAAGTILAQLNDETPVGHKITSGALNSVTWTLGEHAVLLQDPDITLNALLQLVPRVGRPEVSATALLAIAKVFASIAGDEMQPWTAERKSVISLLMARILHVAEPLASHPSLEVQERAVELIELLKITSEAASGQPPSTSSEPQEPPLLLTQAIPSLFNGWELNSVAPGAQTNVPLPEGLDLNEPIHSDLDGLLSQAELVNSGADESDDFEVYYNQRPPPTAIESSAPAINRLADPVEDTGSSYQQPTEDSYLDADIIARRKAERLERNKDDPFYIPSTDTPRAATPIHTILQSSNGPDLDIDSIPIMKLELDSLPNQKAQAPKVQPKPKQNIVIAADETLDGRSGGGGRQNDSGNNSDVTSQAKGKKSKHSLLQVDSRHIGAFSLEGDSDKAFDYEQQQREEAEMEQAMKEVERLRLEMQRANERIQVAKGVDAQGTVIKKKKKKQPVSAGNAGGDGVAEAEAEAKPRRRKKTKTKPTEVEANEAGETPASAEAAEQTKPEEGGSRAASEQDAVVLLQKKKSAAKKKKKMAEIEDFA